MRDWLDQLAAQLHPSPSLSAQSAEDLRSELRALTPTVFESALPAQAIHGDASMSNLLGTDTGLLWNDLEDACVGPVHWDVAGLVVDARARGKGEAFVADFLRAYGGLRLEELEDFIAAHRIYTYDRLAGVRRAAALRLARDEHELAAHVAVLAEPVGPAASANGNVCATGGGAHLPRSVAASSSASARGPRRRR